MAKILFIRTVPYKLDFSKYNVQALGLGKELVNQGNDFDFLYFPYLDRANRKKVIYKKDGNTLRIIQQKGIRLFRTGFSFKALSKKFLDNYDLVICCEYNQIMSGLIAKRHNNTIVYSGPYYNLFMIPFFSEIYDFLFRNLLNKNAKKIFVKSNIAKEYLQNKGYKNIEVLGVGLDIEKYNQLKGISQDTKQIIKDLEKYPKLLLYVGALSKRKNFSFLIKVFNEIYKEDNSVRLLIIGKGNQKYVDNVMSAYSSEVLSNIIIISELKNEQLKYIYPKATAFLLPSINEIFGMVLLEAMYFGTPVISSYNGGSTTVIRNKVNGIIINEFNEKIWSKKTLEILNDPNKRNRISVEAKQTINKSFLWNNIAKRFIENIEVEN